MVSQYARSQMGKYNRIHDFCSRFAQQQRYIASRRSDVEHFQEVLFLATQAQETETETETETESDPDPDPNPDPDTDPDTDTDA